MNDTKKRFLKRACCLISLGLLLSFAYCLSVSAIGNYGADENSPAYKEENPFYPDHEGQNTWYCWGRVKEKCGVSLSLGDVIPSGNAWDWYENARNAGYEVGIEPREDAIAVFSTNDGLGRVAFVEKYENDTAFLSEGDYRYSSLWGGYAETSLSAGETIRHSGLEYQEDLLGFIYLTEASQTGRMDVNFTVDGENMKNIYDGGIGTIEVYIDGTLWPSSGQETYGDFFSTDIPIGKDYEVRINLTNPEYWCPDMVNGSRKGITSVNTVVRFNIRKPGYNRALPDGDYIIATAGAENKESFYYLDIEGTGPVGETTNVSLCGPGTDLDEYDIWTIRYDENEKFYTICQKGTDTNLDAQDGGAYCGANVQAVPAVSGQEAMRWAIAYNRNGGYRLQAKKSGLCLDVNGGDTNTNGTNVHLWAPNLSAAQTWLFIPYRPEQTLPEGRYILLSDVDNSWELDVPGDSGEIGDDTEVWLWRDEAASQYNAFDFTRLDNGYYTITHAASGKALGITGGSRTDAGALLSVPNGSITQQWAITRDGGEGGYILRMRSSGFVLDLAGSDLSFGAKVRQFPWNQAKAQSWTFVPAEYTVFYDANGGSDPPDTQTKYYKTDLTLSDLVPVREGFTFVGWAESPGASSGAYAPGSSYSEDRGVTLYAVWKES